MALQDDLTKFLADFDAFIASPSWPGAVGLTADGAAIIKDIASGGLQASSKGVALGATAVKAACARATLLGTDFASLRRALAAELALPNINWQNVLAILLAILNALGPVLIKG